MWLPLMVAIGLLSFSCMRRIYFIIVLTALPTAPKPKLQPFILTLQMKKYTSAQLLIQNAKKMTKSLHLSLALILRVAR